MNITTLFSQINQSFRGSDDDPPTAGTDFNNWLIATNRKKDEWARDGKHTWRSLFAVNSVGTVSSGSQSYDLDTNFLVASDKVTVTTLTGSVVDYVVGEPQERDRYQKSCYISGTDPQTLTFNDQFSSTDSVIGGTIKVAGYYIPDDYTSGGSIVTIDDPYWLVYAVAADLAFNENSYTDKAPDLNAKANNLYSQMVSNNRRGSSNMPRQARTNVNRIIDPSGESN